MAEQQTLDSGGGDGGAYGGLRAEIDTSAPFESVKEAVSRFGGLGFWKPHHQNLKPSYSLPSCDVGVDAAKMEEQAAELAKELILKERDTLEVLKELEATKMMVEELKSKLQKEESTTQLDIVNADLGEEKENNPYLSLQKLPSSNPGMILMELEQAKLNLTRTTSDLAEIRASVETYNKKIERERISLERTRERLRSNSSKITSLEEEINRTRSKLEEPKSKVMLEIEQTKAEIKNVEIRLVAAMKMKEAAKAAEAVALAEIKALEKSENPEKVTITLEEYSSLRRKAQEAEESCKVKVLEAMIQVDEANASKTGIMKRVEEAMEEVKASKQALEEALNRVEDANRAKLNVEEALRRWRSEHGERRRSIQNSTKFKNPYPSNRVRDTRMMLDLNGTHLVTDAKAPPPVLKPSLSIGEILSKKLLIAEEYESGKGSVKRKVSLGQMLGKQNADLSSAWKMDKDSGSISSDKKLPGKRKKFGFARFPVLLTKQKSKKKKSTPIARCLILDYLIRNNSVKRVYDYGKMFAAD